MENSKLIALLRTFSSLEWRKFSDLVNSPYFNTRPELVRFVEYLSALDPGLSGSAIEKEAVSAGLFPGEPFDGKRLGYLMNYLLRLGEQFLGLERLEADPLIMPFQTMKALEQRGLEKHFQFLLNKGIKELEELHLASSERFQYSFRLSRLKSANATLHGELKQDTYRGEARKALDAFHVLETLKLACERYRQQSISSSLNGLPNLHILEDYFEREKDLPTLISMYYALYKSLKNDERQKATLKLLHLLRTHASEVDVEELKILFSYSAEHCLYFVREQELDYAGPALGFYLEGLRHGIFMKNSLITPEIYIRIIRLFLLENQPQAALEFLRQHQSSLNPDLQVEMLAFGEALVDFYHKEYSTAGARMKTTKFFHARIKMEALILKIKIGYAQEDMDDLLSHLADLTLMVRKDKDMPPDYRKAVNEFCNILHQILRRNPKKRKVLEEQIQSNSLLRERPWLLEVLKEEVDA